MPGHWKNSSLAFAVIALLVCHSTALAKDKVRFGVSALAGYGACQMTDVNKQMQALFNEVNTNIAANGQQGQVTLDDVSHATGLGGGLHAWVTRDILVSAEFERLLAKSENNGTAAGLSYHTEIKLPANVITLSGAYFLPSASKARFGLGAGVGYYNTKASGDFSVNGQPVTDYDLGVGTTNDPIFTREVKGHGFGFHGLGMMDYAATSEVHLGLRVGYRFAKTTELKNSKDDTIVYIVNTITGENTTKKLNADWSGLLARGGITFLFGKAE